MNRELPIIPKLPDTVPTNPFDPVAKCGECGRLIYAVEGYSCPSGRCPVQPKAM